MNSINYINNLSKDEFCNKLGNIFEKTTWIAEKVYLDKPFLNFESLKKSFFGVYNECNKQDYIKIFNSHPQLVIEKVMTSISKKEQKNSKLNTCNENEVKEFTKLNIEYKNKNNFPFIIAVAGLNKEDILYKFKERIKNDYKREFEEAKIQVKKIAEIRLNNFLKETI